MNRKVKHSICARLTRIQRGRSLRYQEVAELSEVCHQAIHAILDENGSTVCPKFSTVEQILIGLDQGETAVVEHVQRPRPTATVVAGNGRRA